MEISHSGALWYQCPVFAIERPQKSKLNFEWWQRADMDYGDDDDEGWWWWACVRLVGTFVHCPMCCLSRTTNSKTRNCFLSTRSQGIKAVWSQIGWSCTVQWSMEFENTTTSATSTNTTSLNKMEIVEYRPHKPDLPQMSEFKMPCFNIVRVD